ncbi:MAG: HAD-IIIA family hydrolase [Proteobacteria bacterium]|nr:HAD-IIIA family hydrolase [Pseudomonadota bacterium]
MRSITFLLLDVDGVLTDGRITYTSDGLESKSFHVRDGLGIVALRNQGCRVGIITGRSSPVVGRRAKELGIDEIHQGAEDKLRVYAALKQKHGLTDREVAFIGDDEPDLGVLRCVGFSAAPADAHESVKKAVMYVCKHRGGEGAVREIVDLILAAGSNRGRRGSQ